MAFFITERIVILIMKKSNTTKNQNKKSYQNNYMDYVKVINSMNCELYILEILSIIYDTPTSMVVYCGDDRKEIQQHYHKVCNMLNIRTLYNDDVQYQRSGADYIMNGVILDLKTSPKDYDNRASFILEYDTNVHEWRFSPDVDNRLIVHFNVKTYELYIFPTRLVEMIVNRKLRELPFDSANYHNRQLYNEKKCNGKYLFNINCDILQKCISTFLDKYCTNNYVKAMLRMCNVAQIDKNNFKEYSALLNNLYKCKSNYKFKADILLY